ncbi:hypothetical protein CA267_014960 [Alteromonas pelagimontana]|uniref:Sulfotransferase domain-containing protein n=1 Tax=Alteromonas pelagimontana TaxID=1858656 RepID=A0A6M4MGG6_9ALTE|nr:sulfotransferase domain-containing protein [Alteromonas pelagimontana]QJR81958.1 hypothetical protein CA267_014960 [Alteromonas pelagimontana]
MKDSEISYLGKVGQKFQRKLSMDVGKDDDVIFMSGMGRSGTTWLGDIVNYDRKSRILFEPFHPTKVKEANKFEYIQYLNPEETDETLEKQARTILAGKVRNSWVDRDNHKFFYYKRIIKDIRCNLMLGWLKKLSKDLPIILPIRHPLQVVSSWSNLGWGKETEGNRSDFEIIMSQQKLLSDFPLIKKAAESIDSSDFVERTVFLWCVFYYVPLQQLKPAQFHIVYYENLIIEYESEVRKLFRYLEKPFNLTLIEKSLNRSSSTNFLKRDFETDQAQLIEGWKSTFTTEQIEKAQHLLAMFKLDALYTNDGYPKTLP